MSLSSIPGAFADLDEWLGALPSPAYIASVATRCLLCVNQHLANLLGYSVDELRHMTLNQIRPAADLPLFEHDLVTLPPQGSADRRYLTKAGCVLIVRLRYRDMRYNLPDGSSQELRFVVVVSSEAESSLVAKDLDRTLQVSSPT